MTSESTRFLGQPNETKPTVGAVGWEDLLTTLLYRECDLLGWRKRYFNVVRGSSFGGWRVLKSISAGSYAT